MRLPEFPKFVMKLVIGAGVNEVLKNIIKSTTPLDLTTTRQLMVRIGTEAITGVVAGVVAYKCVQEIDDAIEEISTFALNSPSKEALKRDEIIKEEFMKGFDKGVNDIVLSENFGAPGVSVAEFQEKFRVFREEIMKNEVIDSTWTDQQRLDLEKKNESMRQTSLKMIKDKSHASSK